MERGRSKKRPPMKAALDLQFFIQIGLRVTSPFLDCNVGHFIILVPLDFGDQSISKFYDWKSHKLSFLQFFKKEQNYEFISNQIDKLSINDCFELITLHFWKIRKVNNIFCWSCSFLFRLRQRWYQNRDVANHLPFWIWSRKE